MSRVDAIDLSGIKSSELGLGLPVELQSNRRAARNTGESFPLPHPALMAAATIATTIILNISFTFPSNQDSASEACQCLSDSRLMRLTRVNSTMPRSDARSKPAKTLSTRFCWRETMMEPPMPLPVMNSPTMAPITARPAAMRSPVIT